MKKITNAGSFNPTSVATEVKSLDAVVAETIVKNSQNYNGVSYASIPLHLLNIPTYQRQLNSSVAKIAAAWNDKKCGAITVSFRDGKFYVIDGQHRVAAAKIAGCTNIFSMILTGMSREDEIGMFVNQNQNCKIVSAYDKIYAQSDGNIAPGAELVAMCKEANIKLKNRGSAGPGELACAAVLRNCYDRVGRDGIQWIFDVIRTLGWHTVRLGYSSTVLRTLASLRFQSDDQEKLKNQIVERTAGMTPLETIRKATMLRPTYGDTAALNLYWGA